MGRQLETVGGVGIVGRHDVGLLLLPSPLPPVLHLWDVEIRLEHLFLSGWVIFIVE